MHPRRFQRLETVCSADCEKVNLNIISGLLKFCGLVNTHEGPSSNMADLILGEHEPNVRLNETSEVKQIRNALHCLF